MKFSAKGTIVLLAAWIAVMGIAILVMTSAGRPKVDDLADVLRPDPRRLTAFTLVDQHREPFTVERLANQWTILFFGYTYCPDICPATLAVLTALDNELRSRGMSDEDYQLVFVSVDPERDSPEHIDKYLGFFGSRITGITGDADELSGFARQFGAMYMKEEPNAGGGYFVAHTSSLFVTSPRQEFLAAFSPPLEPRNIADRFQELVRSR